MQKTDALQVQIALNINKIGEVALVDFYLVLRLTSLFVFNQECSNTHLGLCINVFLISKPCFKYIIFMVELRISRAKLRFCLYLKFVLKPSFGDPFRKVSYSIVFYAAVNFGRCTGSWELP